MSKNNLIALLILVVVILLIALGSLYFDGRETARETISGSEILEPASEIDYFVNVVTNSLTISQTTTTDGDFFPLQNPPQIVDSWPNAEFEGFIRLVMAYPETENELPISDDQAWILFVPEGHSPSVAVAWEEIAILSENGNQSLYFASRPIGEVIAFSGEFTDRENSREALNNAIINWRMEHNGQGLRVDFMVVEGEGSTWQLFGFEDLGDIPAGRQAGFWLCCRVLSCGIRRPSGSSSCVYWGCRNVSC